MDAGALDAAADTGTVEGTMRKVWIAVALGLGLMAATGCMHKDMMDDSTMDKGMSGDKMMDKSMSDPSMMDHSMSDKTMSDESGGM